MPELPEVETVVRGLRQSILGRKILSVWIGKSDFIDNPVALALLAGQRIESIERFGKFMLLRLASVEVASESVSNSANVGTEENARPSKRTMPLRAFAHRPPLSWFISA